MKVLRALGSSLSVWLPHHNSEFTPLSCSLVGSDQRAVITDPVYYCFAVLLHAVSACFVGYCNPALYMITRTGVQWSMPAPVIDSEAASHWQGSCRVQSYPPSVTAYMILGSTNLSRSVLRAVSDKHRWSWDRDQIIELKGKGNRLLLWSIYLVLTKPNISNFSPTRTDRVKGFYLFVVGLPSYLVS
jgi:hypothetical protein